MASVDSNGVSIDTFQAILDALTTAQRAQAPLGATFVTSPDSPAGSMNAVFADRERKLQELLLAIWQALSPYNATGQLLDDVLARSNVLRQDATFSTVTATVNLDDSTTLPAGSRASVDGDPESVYETLVAVSNTTGSADDFSVAMRAVTKGSRPFAAAGTLTEIETSVSGWNTVTNASDSTQGRDIETDAAYLARWAETLSAAGSTNVDAIVAAVRQVAGVGFVSALSNPSNSIDSDGLPPKSFEIIVSGGTDNAVAQAIWDNSPAGIQAFGSASGTATDLQDTSRTVAFSRPTEIPVEIQIDAFYEPNNPAELSATRPTAAEKTAFVQAANAAFQVGERVSEAKLTALWLQQTTVEDIELSFGTVAASSPGDAAITIGPREVATFDTTDIS